MSNNCKSHIGYVENNLYKKRGNRTFNNTNNIYKHINQYSTDLFNNCKVNKAHDVKKTCYNSNNDVFINKHNTINTNDTYNVTKIIVYIMLLIMVTILKRISIQVISLITLQDIVITLMNTM